MLLKGNNCFDCYGQGCIMKHNEKIHTYRNGQDIKGSPPNLELLDKKRLGHSEEGLS